MIYLTSIRHAESELTNYASDKRKTQITDSKVVKERQTLLYNAVLTIPFVVAVV